MVLKTTQQRVYRDDVELVKLKFPHIKFADFFHIVTKTNPLIQVEAVLRKKPNAKKK